MGWAPYSGSRVYTLIECMESFQRPPPLSIDSLSYYSRYRNRSFLNYFLMPFFDMSILFSSFWVPIESTFCRVCNPPSQLIESLSHYYRSTSKAQSTCEKPIQRIERKKTEMKLSNNFHTHNHSWTWWSRMFIWLLPNWILSRLSADFYDTKMWVYVNFRFGPGKTIQHLLFFFSGNLLSLVGETLSASELKHVPAFL